MHVRFADNIFGTKNVLKPHGKSSGTSINGNIPKFV